MTDTATFETALMDARFGSRRRVCCSYCRLVQLEFDEGIDVLKQLLDGGEGRRKHPRNDFRSEDREPDFDLIEPGRARRGEVELHVGVALKSWVVFRLMRVEIVKYHMDCGIGLMGGDDPVHKVQELDTLSPLLVRGNHLARGNLEGGEQGRGAVALVIHGCARRSALSVRPLDNFR